MGLCDYLPEDCATSGMQMVAKELDYELVIIKEVNGNAWCHVVTVPLPLNTFGVP